MRNDVMTVALVEDDRRYREALENVLQATGRFEVVASFDRGEGVLRAARTLAADAADSWDVVLMDIDLPGRDGIQTTRELKKIVEVEVLMLTVFEEPKKIVDAICAGASGYALKRSSARELLSQLDVLRAGGAALSGEVARQVLEIIRRGVSSSEPSARHSKAKLTERERDILRGLVNGRTYRGIAGDLGISVDTVRTHIRNVYEKLQVKSATSAVRKAIREGLT